MVKNGLKFFLFLFFKTLGFAQVLQFGSVQKLSDAINSEAEESMPLLSPDGKTLYFTRLGSQQNTGGKFTGIDIWISERDGTSWKPATNKKIRFNDKGNSGVIGLSSDGKVLYLLNASPAKKIKGIYFSKKTKDGSWGDPELIPIPGMESEGFIDFYVSPDFDVIFISMKASNSVGQEDLYSSVRDKNGSWSQPKSLGETINTSGYEISPFFSATQKRLYFASNGHGGQGDADIFYCDRLYDSWETWSAPKNLGNEINSKDFDGYFSIYGDSLAFFASNRGGQLADLYQAKATMVTKFNDKNYLTERQLESLLGANINRKFIFRAGVTELTMAQKELLWYIANKILSMNEINIFLTAQSLDDKNSSSVFGKRINAMMDYIQLAGIDKSRIKFSIAAPSGKTKPSKEEGIVELLLYE